MTEANGHEGHEPSLEQMVLESSAAGVGFSDAMSRAIDHAHVPMKDGAPDVDVFIKHLIHEASGIAQTYLKDGREPRSMPGYEQLKTVLETTPDATKDGHLTIRGKQALINVYESTVAEYITQREETRFAAASPDDAKSSGKSLANTVSDKFLTPLIEKARTAAETAARVRTAISDAYQKARQYVQSYGNSDGFVPAYAPAQAHGH